MSIVEKIKLRLDKNNIESSRANAETILTSIVGCNVAELYVNNITLDTLQERQLEEMVSRRIGGEPLQYITGKVNFYGNELFVEPGVFIPRPETEILVDTVIKMVRTCNLQPTTKILRPSASGSRKIRRKKKTWQIFLDLCTGSGCIAISLTKALTDCKIIASDISDKSLRFAEKNARENGVSERIDFIKSDLFGSLKVHKGYFDLIVSNPPYVDSAILGGLPEDVKREPRIALNGGIGGLDFYIRIIKDAPFFLKKGGFLALELADASCNSVKEIIKNSGCFSDIRIFNDMNNIERVMVAWTSS